jgi:hypothetical protein
LKAAGVAADREGRIRLRVGHRVPTGRPGHRVAGLDQSPAGGVVPAGLGEVESGALEQGLDLVGAQLRPLRAQQRRDAGDVGGGQRGALHGGDGLDGMGVRGGEDAAVTAVVEVAARRGDVDPRVRAAVDRRSPRPVGRPDRDHAVAGGGHHRLSGGALLRVARRGDQHHTRCARFVDGGLVRDGAARLQAAEAHRDDVDRTARAARGVVEGGEDRAVGQPAVVRGRARRDVEDRHLPGDAGDVLRVVADRPEHAGDRRAVPGRAGVVVDVLADGLDLPRRGGHLRFGDVGRKVRVVMDLEAVTAA